MVKIEKEDEQRTKWFLWIKKMILRVKSEGNPIYLIRYSLFTCPWFAIKLHRIFLSDDDCMHDHPWCFISIILWGGYTECTPAFHVGHRPGDVIRRNWIRPGSIIWRPNPWIHRLEIVKPATTLVITFKKTTAWGFYTSKGWVYWEKFIRSGRKCE